MLRTEKSARITTDRYYRVLGYKSEGGAGDYQIKLLYCRQILLEGLNVLAYES